MKLIDYCIRQPITVAVGVGMALLAGVMALTSVPVQMKPDVDSVVIAVTTFWESASAEEIESDIVEEQEKVLSDVSGLISLSSKSRAGQGVVRLEFETGTDIDTAKAEVLQKLDEVPGYPEAVLQPVVQGKDPQSVDYIAWVGLSSTDPSFDTTTLFDFMERRIKPQLDRLEGVGEVNVVGGRQSELHIRVDPEALAARGITWGQLVQAINSANRNYSAGKAKEGKNDIRIRSTGRFESPEDVASMIVRRDASGPVYLRDVAEVSEGYKEMNNWARARGHIMPFINFQLQRGGNLIGTMDRIQTKLAEMNSRDGILAHHARQLGINGELELVQVYDATAYVRDAIKLVQSNIVYGGILATLTLLFFLRSLRTIGIIALAIPVSIIAAIVVMVSLGRSVNIISLAGMAFAVGMVVDNAIVVIENIFRHMEMGKRARQAALEGASEVAGAVLASTMTTMAVFFPILLIQETAGQLFKDIAYAIMAAVALSLFVSLTIIPSAAARFLHREDTTKNDGQPPREKHNHRKSLFGGLHNLVQALPHFVADLVAAINRSWKLRIGVIATFTLGTVVGIKILMPPLDYLPTGNRNIVFGMMFPPPGYNLDQLQDIGKRVEKIMRPYWEAAPDQYKIEAITRGKRPKEDTRQPIPTGPGDAPVIMPPPIENYFLVSFDGQVFHGAISKDKKRVVDLVPLFFYSTSGHTAPDTMAFAFQMSIFQTGGTTGSAINIDIKGDKIEEVNASAQALMFALTGQFGPYSVKPDPASFLSPSSEFRIVPVDKELLKHGMTRGDVGLSAQANGDGILFFRKYEQNGELRDMKLISKYSHGETPIDSLLDAPIATPMGDVIDLRTVATADRVLGPDEIRHVDRSRAVTLEFTPEAGKPLETAVDEINGLIAGLKQAGAIAPGIDITLAGSASKLNEIKTALLGDGTILGTFLSSMFLAFFVVYLVLVILFQSWSSPIVIMLTVPLATFGGFVGLSLVHFWSVTDRYMPIQNLDMLSILGFIILAGVVVNNAILIIHQTLNFLNDPARKLDSPDDAIIASVRTRVRPILMSSLTSVGGMIPLVLLPGAGSELYRGLGAVVVGGLLVSTVFTLILVPSVLSVFFTAFKPKRNQPKQQEVST